MGDTIEALTRMLGSKTLPSTAAATTEMENNNSGGSNVANNAPRRLQSKRFPIVYNELSNFKKPKRSMMGEGCEDDED